jgi:hypothetical protein
VISYDVAKGKTTPKAFEHLALTDSHWYETKMLCVHSNAQVRKSTTWHVASSIAAAQAAVLCGMESATPGAMTWRANAQKKNAPPSS